MYILFCSDPLDNKKVDLDWAQEYQFALRHKMNVVRFDYDAYKSLGFAKSLSISVKPPNMESILYRGWMMPVSLYAKLYQDLLDLNLRLINSPEEYEHCYYLPRSYSVIKDRTPFSVFYPRPTMPSDEEILELLSPFKEKPIIVKDFVKSQKHYWNEACFIPDASDLVQVKKVVANFIALQGDSLQGGLVFREFIELAPVGSHPKSHMPLTEEYRIFILNKVPITCSEYWEDANYENSEQINIRQFQDIYTTVRNNFFTIDIARKKDGSWLIMELGDGQVAEYLGNSGLDSFYESLSNL